MAGSTREEQGLPTVPDDALTGQNRPGISGAGSATVLAAAGPPRALGEQQGDVGKLKDDRVFPGSFPMDGPGMESESASGLGAEEWPARVDLAALYRLCHHFGWTDLTYSHISARIPGQPRRFLINPYGLLFEEVTASVLVAVDFEGHSPSGVRSYNRTGHLIHTAVLRARPEINFVIHSHTRAGAAVSAMSCGLLPISEHANVVLGSLAYHPYGVVKDGIRRNAIGWRATWGKTRPWCSKTMACSYAGGRRARRSSFITSSKWRVGSRWTYWLPVKNGSSLPTRRLRSSLPGGRWREKPWGDRQWAALLRLLDRKDPDFRS